MIIFEFIAIAPATTSVTTPVSAPDLTTRSIHQHSGAPPPIMSQAKLFGNHTYYPYKWVSLLYEIDSIAFHLLMLLL